MTPDDVAVLRGAYIAAAERAVATFEPLRVEFEAALEEGLAIQETFGPDAPETEVARERIRAAMRAAAGEPGSELKAAFADVDRTRHALRAATLGETTTEVQC